MWFTSNYVKPNINKTRAISFCRKANWQGFNYKLYGSSIICMNGIRDMGQLRKPHFHQQVRNIFSQAVKTVGVNSDFEFLSFVTAQPSGAVLHSSQTHVALCLCCVEFCHFFWCLSAGAHPQEFVSIYRHCFSQPPTLQLRWCFKLLEITQNKFSKAVLGCLVFF